MSTRIHILLKWFRYPGEERNAASVCYRRPASGQARKAWDCFTLVAGLRPLRMIVGRGHFRFEYADPATGAPRSERYAADFVARMSKRDLRQGRRFRARLLRATRAHRRAERTLIDRALAGAEREMAAYLA